MQQFTEFAVNHWDLFLALAVILAMLTFNLFGSRLRGFQDIGPLEAVQLINQQNAALVDVREANELQEGQIPNSLHIPLAAFGKRLDELQAHKDKPVIIGCRSGHRSARACAMLRKQGFESVYNLRGGVMAWQSANLPLSRGESKSRKKKSK